MRILMLTDDVQVDRRILLEAESLVSQGHELILLAGWEEGLPTHDIIGRVKVERIIPPHFSAKELKVLKLQSKCINGLNIFSVYLQKQFAKASALLNVPILKLSPYPKLQRLPYLLQSLWGKVLSFCLKMVTMVAVIVNKLTLILLKGVRYLRILPIRDSFLAERGVYYNPDIVHAHDLPQLRSGVEIKHKLAIPLVYDAHELYPEIDTLSSKQKKELSSIERKNIRNCDAVITVNPFIAKEMANRYSINEPHTILNATNVPETFVKSSCQKFHERFNLSKDVKVVLFQGWMSKTRGLQNLVESMSYVENASIHLVFMGYGEAKDELIALASELAIDKKVHFMDAVSQDELLYWTASADAGFIPYQPVDLNNYYCSPNKLFEFIQAELPIIANDLPFLREIIYGNDFGIVQKLETPEDYAAAINCMFSNNSLKKYICQLKEKKNQYSWAVEEKKLLKIYDNIYDEKLGG